MVVVPPKKYFRKQKSFTLVETLIALFILFIVLCVCAALVSKALGSTQISKSKFIASYLAQEGAELVRNIRDGNWAQGNAWDEGLTDGQWEISYESPSLLPYTGAWRNLNIDESTGFYNYNSGSPSIFIRKIIISRLEKDNNTLIRVLAEVNWNLKGQSYSLSVIEDLYDWYSWGSVTPTPPVTPPIGILGYIGNSQGTCDASCRTRILPTLYKFCSNGYSDYNCNQAIYDCSSPTSTTCNCDSYCIGNDSGNCNTSCSSYMISSSYSYTPCKTGYSGADGTGSIVPCNATSSASCECNPYTY